MCWRATADFLCVPWHWPHGPNLPERNPNTTVNRKKDTATRLQIDNAMDKTQFRPLLNSVIENVYYSSSYPSIFWLVDSFPSGIVASHWIFYGCVHRESMSIIVQEDATVYSLLYFCKLPYMFRVVIPHIIRGTYNCNYSIWHESNRLCYLPLWWRSWNCVAETVWPVPDAVITVICAPDDGWNNHPKHVGQLTEI
jgi:hypothetical protein